jgi:predicted transcriptional regulator
MGELIDFAAYKKQKEDEKEQEKLKKEQDELDASLNELEMLKNILSDILEDLPDVETSILYVPIEPKMDAFMSKDVDGYLDKLGLKIDDEREET